jgi:hypothetical protein
MAVALHYGRNNDPPTQYFQPWLICDPWLTPPDWEIDRSTLDNACRRAKGKARMSAEDKAEILAEENWRLYQEQVCAFQGVLVKNTYRKQVWRLTGNVDSHGYLEGRWPD